MVYLLKGERMNKTIGMILLVMSIFIISSCGKDQEEVPMTLEISSVEGLEDTIHPVGKYFNALDGVRVYNESLEDIKHLFEIHGFVDYGTVGTYVLDYALTYGEDELNMTREIEVVSASIQASVAPSMPSDTMIASGFGSIRTGNATNLTKPLNPTFLDQDLYHQAIPSSSWWTSMMVQPRGGGNGLYTNPYRTSFQAEGMEFTNANDGFVQYWQPDGFNTIANFSLAIKDVFVNSKTLQANYETYVTGYGDTHVEIAMRNPGDLKDHVVTTLLQGSPHVFYQVMDKASPELILTQQGNSGYEFYSTNGLRLDGTNHIGDGIIIKIIGKHVGYQTSYPSQVGQPIFEDVYILLATPDQTQFTWNGSTISLDLNTYNYFSLSTVNGISDAQLLLPSASMLPVDSDVSYVVDEETSEVITTYTSTYLNTLKSDMEPLMMVLPHQQQYSTLEYVDFSLRTVRGHILTIEGNTFETVHSFGGIIPSFPLPEGNFDASEQTTYIESLLSLSLMDDEENLLNDDAPYWNAKVLFPLVQSLIASDEMDSETKAALIDRIKYVLEDWFSYGGVTDDKYLYYDPLWNTTYYSDNTFSTASELNDHSFTHGYLVYAAAILSQYDEDFKSSYEDIIDFFLADIMYPYKDEKTHAYLRHFDPYAGHTWAHGYGTFAEGNNIESTSEAIQSWVAGYLWALETNNQELRDAAIYGYVHEVASAKMYMFDYEDMIFPNEYDDYTDVAGMLWGGKYDYATWFGANPTFIYGIQWMPNATFLTTYAMNASERQILSNIFQMYLQSKGGTIDTWFANMWIIQALVDPDAAVQMFDASLILNDDFPTDLAQTYYLIHSLNHYGFRDDSYYMQIHDQVSSSLFINDAGHLQAVIWNASATKQTVTFTNGTNEVTVTVDGQSLTAVKIA